MTSVACYRVTFTFNSMESEGSLPYFQELVTGPQAETDQSTAPTILHLRFTFNINCVPFSTRSSKLFLSQIFGLIFLYNYTVYTVVHLIIHTDTCTHTHTHTYIYIYIYILFKKSKIHIKTLKTLLHVSITRSSSGSIRCSLLKL